MGHLDVAAGHMGEMMDATMTEMSKLQPGPMGTRERGTRERNRMFKDMVALPPAERQVIMMSMAERAGHQPDEDRPCELCRFLADQLPSE